MGSALVNSGYVINTADVTTASNTFTLADGATIIDRLTVNGGRAIIDGHIVVDGEIFVNNATLLYPDGKGDYDEYSTAGVKTLKYSAPFGVAVDIQTIVDMFDPSVQLPGFLNLGYHLKYAAAAGVLDLNNSRDGYNINTLRNVSSRSCRAIRFSRRQS